MGVFRTFRKPNTMIDAEPNAVPSPAAPAAARAKPKSSGWCANCCRGPSAAQRKKAQIFYQKSFREQIAEKYQEEGWFAAALHAIFTILGHAILACLLVLVLIVIWLSNHVLLPLCGYVK